MDALLSFAKDLLMSQPIMQAFAGAAAIAIVAALVLRGAKDRDPVQHAPGGSVAPGDISSVPAIFAQGPREMIDILREQRDMDRRRTEDSAHIRECVRTIRDETKRQTEILDEIRDDQRLEHRLNSERERRHSS
nr:hypothetical protein NG677_17590 [Methylobacterium sp. OTU13CASTA1]